MPKFTLKVDYPVVIGNPRKRESMTVDPGKTVEVSGEVVTSRPDDSDLPPLPEDAYIVADAGEERAWPHALWDLVGDKQPAKSGDKAATPAVKEN